MPTDKQIVAFKIGARARKLASEDCIIEGYEILQAALSEAQASGDVEITDHLRRELEKYERRYIDD